MVRHSKEVEGGFSLIEVVVAMFIFALISVGLLYTLTSVLVITRDSKARHVAGNLAAQEIDLVHSASDIFALNDDARTVELNGDTFDVTRSTSWVTADDELAACGAGGGTLRYKHVKVEVAWNYAGQARTVESDTLVSPSSRINDPDLGTILVNVRSAVTGEGVAGIPVQASVGGTTLTATTDAAGCAYLLKVQPNNYTVRLAATGYVDPNSNPNPSEFIAVAAGSSTSVPFLYDRPGELRFSYVSAEAGSVPRNLPTTLLSTREPVVSATSSSQNPRLMTVAPVADGFTAIAGDAVDCEAADPGKWLETATHDPGQRGEPVAALSGTIESADIAMGAVRVTGMSTSPWGGERYLAAVSSSPTVEGAPSCDTQQVLRFEAATSSSPVILLPYGTWTIHSGSSSGFSPNAGNRVQMHRITALTPGQTEGPSFRVTLDPRAEK